MDVLRRDTGDVCSGSCQDCCSRGLGRASVRAGFRHCSSPLCADRRDLREGARRRDHTLSRRYAMDFRKPAQRYCALGPPAAIAKAIQRFHAAGVRHVILDLLGPYEERDQQIKLLPRKGCPCSQICGPRCYRPLRTAPIALGYALASLPTSPPADFSLAVSLRSRHRSLGGVPRHFPPDAAELGSRRRSSLGSGSSTDQGDGKRRAAGNDRAYAFARRTLNLPSRDPHDMDRVADHARRGACRLWCL